MIIEFVGAPGAGKSSWLIAFEQYLKRHYSVIDRSKAEELLIRRHGKRKLIMLSVIKSFYLSSLLIALSLLLSRGIRISFKLTLFRWYIHTKMIYSVLEYAECDIVLLDEGNIQRVISCMVSEKNLVKGWRKVIIRYCILNSDILVCLSVEPEEILNRIKNREEILRFVHKSQEQKHKILSNYKDSLGALLEFKNVLYIDNNEQKGHDQMLLVVESYCASVGL